MHKKIVETLTPYGFTFEKTQGYGQINGYETNIILVPGVIGPVLFFSTYLSQAQKNDFILKFNSLKISLCQASFFDYGVAVVVGLMTYGGFSKKFNEVLPKVMEILDELQAPKSNICPQSGEEFLDGNYETVRIPQYNALIKLTKTGVNIYHSSLKKAEEDFKAAPNNYLKGFLGILVGGVAGAILAIIFELIGFISWLSPLVSIFLGTFLYKKFGGKQTFVMILMSFFTTLVLILGFIFIANLIACTKACADIGFSETGIDAMRFVLENNPDYGPALISDFAVNTLIILVVEGFSISALLRQIKRPTKAS